MDGRFNSVAILDAIPNGEWNTARRLLDDLKDIAGYTAMGLHVRYFRVESTKDLQLAATSLVKEAMTAA